MSPFRYAWRQLRRTPGFTATAVITLALGIAANTVFFSIVNALVFKPLPGADLTGVSLIQRGALAFLPYGELRDLAERPTSGLAMVAGSRDFTGVRIQAPGRVEHLTPELVTGDYARVLGLGTRLGRWIVPQDDVLPRGEAVAVISDRLWRQWFGGRDDVVGRGTLRIAGEFRGSGSESFQIVGVALPDYQGLRGRYSNRDVWLPASAAARLVSEPNRNPWVTNAAMTPLVRLAAGVTTAEVEAALQTRLGTVSTTSARQRSQRVSVTDAAPALRGDRLYGISGIILIIAPLVLIAACANLANMLYARGASRAAETAVRLALGAGRRHLLALLVSEIAIIAGLAAATGLTLALLAVGRFESAFPYLVGGRYSNFRLDLSPDLRVVAFALAAAAVAGLIVTTLAAIRVMRQPLLATLAGSGAPSGLTARHGRLRNALVGLQVTVAVILVMVSGFAWEGLRNSLDRRGLVGRQVHYDTSAISAVQINLDYHGYQLSSARSFLERVAADVKAISNVEDAALADVIPGGPAGKYNNTMFAADDGEGKPHGVRRVNGAFARVSAGLPRTLGLRLRLGRDFDAGDAEGAPLVAIVGQRTAAALWPGEHPIGQRMLFGVQQWLTVVGVADDAISADGGAALVESHFVLVPYLQHYARAMPIRVVARTRAPDGHAKAISDIIRAVDADIAVLEAGFIEDAALAWLKPEQAATMLLISLGGLALGISMLGVYGVIAWFVSTRTREFGIRLALGASRRGVVKLVIDQAVHITLIGLLAGVFIVSVASRVIQSRRFDFMPNEIETWIIVPVMILLAGIVAGAVPAARAARVSPNVALKES